MLLMRRNLPLVIPPRHEPPSQNNKRQRPDNHTRIIHAFRSNGHAVGKTEKHNREQQPTDRNPVDDPPPERSHVEVTLVHVPPPRQHVSPDGDQVGDVVDGDGGAQHAVEGGGAAQVQTPQGGDAGAHGDLGVDRHAEARRDLGDEPRKGDGVVAREGPEDPAGR